jgi:hypothetical protein
VNCLSRAQVYRYLERELTPPERQELEGHLASCPMCWEAVETRRRLTEAASTLPDLEIPADFSARVMARIAGSHFSLRGLLIFLAAGCSATLVALGLAMVVTRQSLPGVLVGLNQYVLRNLKSLSLTFIKFFKFFLLIFKIFSNIIEELIAGLSVLTSLVSPQAQILLITLTLLLSITLFVMVKRRFSTRDNHEQ